jgi:hypothetical protein
MTGARLVAIVSKYPLLKVEEIRPIRIIERRIYYDQARVGHSATHRSETTLVATTQ